MTTVAIPPHPAKYSDSILIELAKILDDEVARLGHSIVVLDPLAGVGRIHELATDYIHTWGNEIEPEWALSHERTFVGDATCLDALDETFEVTCTSPPYANRLSDKYDGRDGSKRMTYRIQLGRELSPESGASMQWGDLYRQFAKRVLAEMIRVTKPGGLVIINISNHIRKFEEQFVSEWWLAQMLLAGLLYEKAIPVETPRMGFGQNHEARVDCEWIFVWRKSA